MRGLLVGCSLLLALASPAVAAPTPPAVSPEARAVEVAAVWKAKDFARLRDLAGADDPDPWLVADALLVRGEAGSAAAFAKTVLRKDVERLPAHVESWKASDADARAREAIVRGNALRADRKEAEALTAFTVDERGVTPVVAVRLAFGRALATRALGKAPEAAELFRAVETECEKLGWLRRQAEAARLGARAEAAVRRYPTALDAYERAIKVEEIRRAPSAPLAETYLETARFLAEGGVWERAAAADGAALEVYEKLGDVPGQAATLVHLAFVETKRRRPDAVVAAAQRALGVAEPAGLHADVARSRLLLGTSLRDQGRFQEAIAELVRAVEPARRARDAGIEGQVHLLVGRCELDLGAPERSLEPLRRSVATYESLGPQRVVATSIVRAWLARALAEAGRVDEARATRQSVDEAMGGNQDRWVRAASAYAFAAMSRREGQDPIQALEAAASHWEAVGEPRDALLASIGLAGAHLDRKRVAEGKTAADRALEGAKKLGDPYVTALATLAAARARAESGERAPALDLAREARAEFVRLAHARGTADADALLVRLGAPASK